MENFHTKNTPKPQLSRLCSDEFLQALACPLSPENSKEKIEANNETKIREAVIREKKDFL